MSQRILISRTDSIGDVVLTLPLAGYLRRQFPQAHIGFLCRDYTAPVVRQCVHINTVHVLGTDDAALQDYHTAIAVFPEKDVLRLLKASGIAVRIATAGRLHTRLYANRRVRFSRRKSDLHEAQLNFRLLEGMDIHHVPALTDIAGWYGLQVAPYDPDGLIDPERFNLILHPKSQGSAREWGLGNFGRLIDLLPANRFRIYVSGTAKEQAALQPLLQAHRNRVTDITGRFTLQQFMGFIAAADGVIAASTGPLHLAAATGRHAVGIFAPMRPIHPGRWAPLGAHARTFCVDKTCNDCRKGASCHCIAEVQPETVAQYLIPLTHHLED
jgi:ADP-heptose:LPS heptosyltransferase